MIRAAAAGWLIAFVAVSSIPLGSLVWLLIYRLTGGHWGDRLQPTFAVAVAGVPFLVIAFIPVLAAVTLLYSWVEGAAVKADVATFYLNVPLFVLRAAFGFAGWTLIAVWLPRVRGPLLAGFALIFHTVIMSLLATDWILASEPPFISESFGVTIVVAQLLAALAFAAIAAPPIDEHATRDLGGLMLAVCLGFTYLNFMTVLVMWYSDLPSRVSWFVERTRPPWNWLALAAFVSGSLLPNLALMLTRVRTSRSALRIVAISILAGLALFYAWLLGAAYGAQTLVTATVAIAILGGAFAFFMWRGWLRPPFLRVRTAA